MADAPEALTLRRHRDLAGRGVEHWVRFSLLMALLGVILIGAANGFGQEPDVERAATDRAELQLYAPERVRGGLYFEARFTIHALQELENARLVLGHGWNEGMTINTIVPSPVGEASADGRVALELGHVPAGEKYVLYLQLQVNPTTVGRKDADVRLFDGDTHVLTLRHRITTFP